uniref:Uncharacterized protein n=1 Tax=Acrobeloides nanus TaxID=290746 RepID=A0A914CYG0_9BILA
MTHLCIGNIVSLIDWQTTCIMMIFPIKLNLGDAYGRLLAAFDACDFVLPHLFMLALAIIRLIVICEISLPFNINNTILCHVGYSSI